jgi:hypothetical protein
MNIEELTNLDAAGFIAGKDETEAEYLDRVSKIRSAHADFLARLEATGSAEALDGIVVRSEDAIPSAFYDNPAEITRRIYGFEVRHVPGFFLSRQVGLLWGGCLIGDSDLNFSLFLLRGTFRKREKWLFYRRDELLAHELCHSARQALGEVTLEEFFAYQTSPSLLRRKLGNCFIRDRDAILFVLPSLLLLAAEIIRGFLFPSFPSWIFWPAAVAYPIYLLIRNQISLNLVKRARKALVRCGVGEPFAVMFRCTREELGTIAGFTSSDELRSFAAERGEKEVRWRIILERFLQ